MIDNEILCLRFTDFSYFWRGIFYPQHRPTKSLTGSHAGKGFFSNHSRNRGHLQIFAMARGNQRDKAREANQKKMAEQVSDPTGHRCDKPCEKLPS
jgi:hypothetical protein